MRPAGTARRIGVFGGTFDPVHNGHLRTALELVGALRLDELRLIPCHTPATRVLPATTPGQRLAMLRLAIADCPPLRCDDREIRRGGTSYTIDTLRSLYGVPVGYSDHTLGIEVPVLAVAAGAVMIEKHFTLDRSLEGPDHALSADPAQLRALVARARAVERILGSDALGCREIEQPIAPYRRFA